MTRGKNPQESTPIFVLHSELPIYIVCLDTEMRCAAQNASLSHMEDLEVSTLTGWLENPQNQSKASEEIAILQICETSDSPSTHILLATWTHDIWWMLNSK